MSRVAGVDLEPIFDSRGQATVEATVVLSSGARGTAGAPSGASTGRHEARAFPKDGVPGAIRAFRERLRPRLLGVEGGLSAFDATLRDVDRTPDLSEVGGNTATALSVAAALALAEEGHRPLWRLLARPGVDGTAFPAIVGNCLNGGRHAIGGPDIQEFHAVARGATPELSVRGALRVHALVGEALRARQPGAALGRGDEGGWVSGIGNVEAFEVLRAACDRARDELKVDVRPGVDFAASEFFRDGRYRYREQTLDTDGQRRFVEELVDRFGLVYVEDPFEQESLEAFAELTRSVGDRTTVVGDDVYVTQAARLREGIERHASNAILVKVNQVGTLTSTLETVDLARAHRIATVTSHRSGDLPEGWLAHVALASAAWGLKCGVLGGERVAKLNELLRLGRATPPP
ncbi:MAG TPA: enolase C-terminal domain-like protein [Thermoplasmata archaeon]|nr:enolase C-terminal domain-like protein [Thermoplasmata archaeon]